METLKTMAIIVLAFALGVSLVEVEVGSIAEMESALQQDEPKQEVVQTVTLEPFSEKIEEPEEIDIVGTLRVHRKVALKDVRDAALVYRLGFTETQIEILEEINRQADFKDLSQQEIEDMLRLSYASAGVLTKKQADDYFEVMRDYEQMLHEEYTTGMTSEIRLLLGLDEEKLDEVYGVLYDMPEDSEAALASVLDEKQMKLLREYYEEIN